MTTKKNKVAYILIGPSGSGKSTYIEQLKLDHQGQDINVFSLDLCRMAYFGLRGPDSNIMCGLPTLRQVNINIPEDKEEASQFYSDAFNFCIENSKDFDQFVNESWIDIRNNSDIVIVDNTNVSKKSRLRWVNDLRNAKTAGQFGFHIVMVEFLVPLDTLVARQKTRGDKTIPISAVYQQFFRYESAMQGSECDEVRVVTNQDREVLGDSDVLNRALASHKAYVNSKVSK